MNNWVTFFGTLTIVGLVTWYFLKSLRNTCNEISKKKHKKMSLYEMYAD